MDVSIELHLYLLLYSLIIGAALAAVYDVFRLIRTAIGCGLDYSAGKLFAYKLPLIGMLKVNQKSELKKVVNYTTVLVFDLIYMVFLSAAAVIFIYHCNSGEVRWFSLAGAALGFIIYMKTAGRLTAAAAGAILFAVKALIRYIIFFTVKPLILIVRRTAGLILIIYRKTICKAILKRRKKRSEMRFSRYLKTLGEELDKSFTGSVL